MEINLDGGIADCNTTQGYTFDSTEETINRNLI